MGAHDIVEGATRGLEHGAELLGYDVAGLRLDLGAIPVVGVDTRLRMKSGSRGTWVGAGTDVVGRGAAGEKNKIAGRDGL